MASESLPHPVTGQPFPSPVPPGTGWPGDPADAADAGGAGRPRRYDGWPRGAATSPSWTRGCRCAGPARGWCAGARTSPPRASGPRSPTSRTGAGRCPGFGDPDAAGPRRRAGPGGQRRQPDRPHVHRRPQRRLAVRRAAPGRAGQPADQRSHAGDGLELTGVRIVAAVRCAPPANKPTPEERDTCAPWLDRDLALAAPTVRSMLALGGYRLGRRAGGARRLGWDACPGRKPRFGHGAEAVLDRRDGTPIRLLGSYHVSQQNTFTGKLTEPMLDAVIARL